MVRMAHTKKSYIYIPGLEKHELNWHVYTSILCD